MNFRVTVEEKETGVFNVVLYGSLDASTYLQFEKRVEPILVATTKAVVINMKDVNYVSSMGIQAIFKVMNTMHQFNGQFLMTNLQPQIQKVFDIVKISSTAIFKSMEEADEYLNAIQKKYYPKDKP